MALAKHFLVAVCFLAFTLPTELSRDIGAAPPSIASHLATPPSSSRELATPPLLTVDHAAPAWLTARDAWLLESQLEDGIQIDAVVSHDGSGNYKTIGEAIAAAPRRSTARHIIYVKKGTYPEYPDVGADVWNLMLMGEGMEDTVITGNKSFKGGKDTKETATLAVHGVGFMARDITIENTAGPVMEQAVALFSNSDKTVVLRCGIRGFQDTLYAHSNLQFYRECKIFGTVDFIFGDAAALFQNCTIVARLPKPGQPNTITAQGRIDPTKHTGFSFQYCTVTADDELRQANFTVDTYLGRPWKNYSRVVFMESYLTDVVHPKGWIPWNDSRDYLNTLFYGEFGNSGPGASVAARVQWPGVHSNLSASEASSFTARALITAEDWLPSRGVNFTSGF